MANNHPPSILILKLERKRRSRNEAEMVPLMLLGSGNFNVKEEEENGLVGWSSYLNNSDGSLWEGYYFWSKK